DGYKYAHDYEGHFVEQQFLPDALTDARFWQPQPNPQEDKLKERMGRLWGERFNS
ncbi:MAG: replication-associated recombination protein A, partial [Bacteroidaceae bacterium]|nr:replication-associated recombination protein A [Bacteroidaceae bacterium]